MIPTNTSQWIYTYFWVPLIRLLAFCVTQTKVCYNIKTIVFAVIGFPIIKVISIG